MIYSLIEDGEVINRAVVPGEMPEGWAGADEVWVPDDTRGKPWHL